MSGKVKLTYILTAQKYQKVYNMKYLLILLIFTLSASARIGETVEECKKRYGKTTIKTNKHQMKYAQFYKNNFHILCLFDDDKCAYIIYLTKRRNFKKGEEKKAFDEFMKRRKDEEV